MGSRFAKILVGLAVTGGTIGLGLGVGSAISSAAGNSTSTTNPRSPSTTAPSTTPPSTNRHCPNMVGAGAPGSTGSPGGATTSGVAVY